MGGSVTDRSSFMLKKECALADVVQKQQITCASKILTMKSVVFL